MATTAQKKSDIVPPSAWGLRRLLKEKNVPEDKKGRFGYGDVWTWTSIDSDTKLVMSWLVADRSAAAATEFIGDLAERIDNKIQLTTDGYKV